MTNKKLSQNAKATNAVGCNPTEFGEPTCSHQKQYTTQDILNWNSIRPKQAFVHLRLYEIALVLLEIPLVFLLFLSYIPNFLQTGNWKSVQLYKAWIFLSFRRIVGCKMFSRAHPLGRIVRENESSPFFYRIVPGIDVGNIFSFRWIREIKQTFDFFYRYEFKTI